MPSRLTLPVPGDVDLPRVVCSYGYYQLAPSRWEPEKRVLRHTLRLKQQKLVQLKVSQPQGKGGRLQIDCEPALAVEDSRVVKQALGRMLRLDEDMTGWYQQNKVARKEGFGRLFRSASLFEDMVKTLTGCNVTWRNTVSMNAKLVEYIGKGAFPTPRQLASITEDKLKAECKVGYRAAWLIELAKGFVDHKIDADWYESPERTAEELYQRLLKLKGFGAYAAANMLQLLGHYDHLPIDTETCRHYCQKTGQARPSNDRELHQAIEAHYEPYRPYRFLKYWHELWSAYEQNMARPGHK